MTTVKDLHGILGKNVKFYRRLRGWSQAYLAEKIDVSVNTISDIETTRKFAKLDTLVNLASAFETEVYKLLMPENVFYEDVGAVLAKYSEEVKDAVEKIRDSYMVKREELAEPLALSPEESPREEGAEPLSPEESFRVKMKRYSERLREAKLKKPSEPK